MVNKPARTVQQQLQILKDRGMLFRNEPAALEYLKNISYYRLKGYWWDMQIDRVNHTFESQTYFEDVIERYTFDRKLRLILFDAIERIEIALRTKMIYFLSLSHGDLWYKNPALFRDTNKHQDNLNGLIREFNYSQEIFIKDHKNRYPGIDPEAWKILEVCTIGTLSKFYKNLNHQLPEKATIAKEMGLNLHSELASWLEAIVYVRNIIAHHSRLWSRNMVKTPKHILNNPQADWLDQPLSNVQKKKPFLIISTLLFLCNKVTPQHKVKERILQLFNEFPNVPIYRVGFMNQWRNQNLWK
jgi:abortive infection bacteriophage resistance protein